MAKLRPIDFAALSGKSKNAISMHLHRGKLVKDADGFIDTENPLNATFLAKNRRPPNKKTKKEKPAKVEAPFTSPILAGAQVDLPLTDDEDDVEDFADARNKLTIASIKQKEADTRLKEIKTAQLKGVLIGRDLVRRKFSQFDVALKTNFRDAPRRIAAQVHAIALSGTVADVEKYLEKEITDALRRSVEAAQKEELI